MSTSALETMQSATIDEPAPATPTPPATDAPAATPATPPAAPADPPSADPPATPTPDATPDAPATPTEPARDAQGRFTAPVVYDLTLPEHAVLDADAIEKTIAIARESGFSPEQAQKALELANTLATTQQDAVMAAHQPGGAAWAKQLDGWKAETMADPTLGKTPEERTAAIQRGVQVIDRFAAANPETGAQMKEFLNVSGLGEHRTVAHFLSWLGKAASEGPPVSGSAPGTPKSAVDVFYPKGVSRTAAEVAADP